MKMQVLFGILAIIKFATSEKCINSEDFFTPYPTNFWAEHVPKFVNNRPTIGIVAMEVLGQKMLVNVPWSWDKDYFGSSFVKLVESAGGRAVPIKEVKWMIFSNTQKKKFSVISFVNLNKSAIFNGFVCIYYSSS